MVVVVVEAEVVTGEAVVTMVSEPCVNDEQGATSRSEPIQALPEQTRTLIFAHLQGPSSIQSLHLSKTKVWKVNFLVDKDLMN